MPRPHWLGMRPNWMVPSGVFTSPQACLTRIELHGEFLPASGATWFEVVMLAGTHGARLPSRVTPSGVEPRTMLSRTSTCMCIATDSDRCTVGSRRTRMLLEPMLDEHEPPTVLVTGGVLMSGRLRQVSGSRSAPP